MTGPRPGGLVNAMSTAVVSFNSIKDITIDWVHDQGYHRANK
jgi:hypothetical protein